MTHKIKTFAALQANVVVSFLRAAVSTDLSSLLSFRRKGVNEAMVRRRILEYYGRSDSVNALAQREFSQVNILSNSL